VHSCLENGTTRFGFFHRREEKISLSRATFTCIWNRQQQHPTLATSQTDIAHVFTMRYLFVAFHASVIGTHVTLGENLAFSTLGPKALCSPRKLTVHSDGSIYVAESGIGATDIPEDPSNSTSCVPEFDGWACIGSTGRVSKIDSEGVHSVVVDNLFSVRPISGFGESHSTGPQSICFDGNDDADESMYIIIGLGVNGTELEADGIDIEFGFFGSVLRSSLDGEGDLEQVAKPWVSEYEFNYDGAVDSTGVLPVPNSNPYHIDCEGDHYYVVCIGWDRACILVALPHSLDSPSLD
jgi:hypothetical protein